MSNKTRPRQGFGKARVRKLKLKLLNNFLLWRDHLSPTKEVQACFERKADTVEKISRKDLRLYHKVESAILFPAALRTTLAEISKGVFIPDRAEHFLRRIIVLCCNDGLDRRHEAIVGSDYSLRLPRTDARQPQAV